MIAATLAMAALGRAAGPALPVIAIRNATVHTAAGPVLEKSTVLVRNGLIEAVGPNVAVPADAWVMEAPSLHVYPGLTDALSTWGLPAAPAASGGPPAATAAAPARGPEDRPSNTSWLRAQDLVNPTERTLTAARNAGFTTAAVFPSAAIFAGQGALVNLAGEKAGQMTVATPLGQYLGLSARGFTSFPGSLMGVMAYIRQVYLDADAYRAEKAAYAANPRGARRPAYDRALEGVLDSPRLLLPAVWSKELVRMAEFGAEFKRPVILYGAHDAARVAPRLAQSGAAVLVSLKWPERGRDADPEAEDPLRVLELREIAPAAPAALAKAGVKFAFYAGGVERPADLRAAVKKAIDAGLDREAAVRALTLSAAEIYGVADRLGSIEPGKIANLTVTDGDLFQTSTKIKFVVIDGVKYEPAPEAPARQQQEERR
ncbi:MAG: amidohydrolase family protein [Bryobacterales bacterium]|nr:amidohydrolase family protein [Bryobacterales bacterium]